jgi:alpha-1,6-mannosyltransferase
LPVVVPDAGGAAALAAPEYAERYTPGDVDSCAWAIERMLARDRDLTCAAAATRAQQLLAPREHFERLFALYDHTKGAASALKS